LKRYILQHLNIPFRGVFVDFVRWVWTTINTSLLLRTTHDWSPNTCFLSRGRVAMNQTTLTP